ncbi:hypothetical protein ASPCAL14637 [Aspergillus calidoustus]|uniref:BZIP domain-containing protein n=1 Tax=Aspergillus calidoustus TaxID=454130 RepID=A0A0U5GIH5_ASPCI|nr:hypothetical protein ASPCAL14637 [Aspergillus calidoustus]
MPPSELGGNDLTFFFSLNSRPVSASASTDEDNVAFCLPPVSVSHSSSSPTASLRTPATTATTEGLDSRTTKRKTQNRTAQRRFRERREQERTQLLALLQKLKAENTQISAVLGQTRERKVELEARAAAGN